MSTGEPRVEDAGTESLAIWTFVLAVFVCALAAVAYAWTAIPRTPLSAWAVGLAILTIGSSRFAIAVPGQPATVSVSEVFVFASILLFGPVPAVVTVTADGLLISLQHRNRRVYRTLFNMAEPALSTVLAAVVFFAAAHTVPLALRETVRGSLLLPSAAMSLSYFLSNTLLQAVAVGIENRTSIVDAWRQHATYVAINYYAAGALATLAVRNGVGLDLDVVGLAVPLLLLSYGAYKSAASRVDDARRHVTEIEHLYQATVETLAIAVDAKDQVTHGHIRRVQRHTVALAKALGVTDPIELKALEAASLLHDIGKLAVPDYILNKPGALSAGEFEQMKQHATIGATILTTVHFPYPVVPIVRHHHEQWCGKGYPDQLSGEAIPLGARILTVVDCFDAVTSDRPYRRKLTDEQALDILRTQSGTMYDPKVVERFIELLPLLRREDQHVETGHGASALELTADTDLPLEKIPSTQIEVGRLVLRDGLAEILPGADACFFVQAEKSVAAAFWTERLGIAVRDMRIPTGDGLAGWVAAHRHTIVNSNADLDLGAGARELRLGSCCVLPVFALGTLVGVLGVYLPEGQRCSPQDVRKLGGLAQELGTALLPLDDARVIARIRGLVAA